MSSPQVIHQVVYFYNEDSRHDLKIKQVLEAMNIDRLQILCANNPAVYDALINDDFYGITSIPAILIKYVDGDFKVLLKEEVDAWVGEIIQNYEAAMAAESFQPPTQPPAQPQAQQQQPQIISYPHPQEHSVTNVPQAQPHPQAPQQSLDTPLIDISEEPESIKKVTGVKNGGEKVKASDIVAEMQKQRELADTNAFPEAARLAGGSN